MQVFEESPRRDQKWWQEKETPQTTPWYREASSVRNLHPPQPQEAIDLWDELEAEAARRATLEKRADVIEGSNALSRQRRLWFTLVTVLPAVLFYAFMASQFSSFFFGVLAFGYLLMSVGSLWQSKPNRKAAEPSFKISALGITVDLPEYRLGPIYWDEIQSVSAVAVLGTPCVQIRLKEPEKTVDRALTAKRKSYAKLYHWMMVRGPLQIDTDAFRLPASEIAAQIANFRP